MDNIFNCFTKNKIINPPYDYNFLVNLEEREYPRYLARLFYLKTGEKLPLLKAWSFKSGEWKYKINKKKLKTFNQKIQWIKLYGITDLMRDCTDKVKVRDYVRERIGAEYLKPALQIVRNEKLEVRSDNSISNSSLLTPNLFDKVDFEKLPDSFVIKCNHGCKWHYIIKNKEEYLKNKRLVDITRRNITGWLEQDYSFWGGFEMQYHGIEPKILIEPLLREQINIKCRQIQVYCFSGNPELFIQFGNNFTMNTWDKNFKPLDNIFNFSEKNIKISIDNLINQTHQLSALLSIPFKFVRVDWMLYQNKLYFEELTFTPYSGMIDFTDRNYALIMGDYIKLK